MTESHKGTIGILTGGGDVPGLNPAIRAVTFRALREGYRVLGIRRGWAGLVDLIPDKDADNSGNVTRAPKDPKPAPDRTAQIHCAKLAKVSEPSKVNVYSSMDSIVPSSITMGSVLLSASGSSAS